MQFHNPCIPGFIVSSGRFLRRSLCKDFNTGIGAVPFRKHGKLKISWPSEKIVTSLWTELSYSINYTLQRENRISHISITNKTTQVLCSDVNKHSASLY